MPGTSRGLGILQSAPALWSISELRGGVVEEGVVSKPSPRSPSLLSRDGGSHLEEMVIEITE